MHGEMLHWFYWQLQMVGSVSNKFIVIIYCLASSLHTKFLSVSVFLYIAILYMHRLYIPGAGALPDIYTRTPGVRCAQGRVWIYQAGHGCLGYSYFLHSALLNLPSELKICLLI